eukprot:1862878-Pyramimonas_sp.AAC.1
MKLMHLPRTHRIDAAAVSEQFSRGVVELQYERTQNEAADIGTKRFTDHLAWVKASYFVNIVTPKFWAAQRCQDCLESMFSDGLPLKPGGILKPRLGPGSGLRRGSVAPSKKMDEKKKRPNKGKSIVHTSKPINIPAAPGGAIYPAGTKAAPGKAVVARAPSKAAVANAPGQAVEA